MRSKKTSSRTSSDTRPRRQIPRAGGASLVALLLAFLAWCVGGDWQGLVQRVVDVVQPDAGPDRRPAVADGSWPALPQGQYRYDLQGQVVHVADGDTLTLRPAGEPQRRIRLANIDAPEAGDGAARPGQPHGVAARRELDRLVAGRNLKLRCYEEDQYGRDVCDVMLGENDSANRRMVAAGYAWANQQGKGKHLRDRHVLVLEQQAQRDGLGIWADSGAIRPWVWRYDCWQQGKC
ncbi:thermonuclease family protein [Kerstersia gyiorum]|uniref:thermonuclease family protein n=1 Tax=Kerstersia gyiorum TaxID=206506 RepID=UPI00209F24F9|nr:thermonuclease family protein [Kerstersia gyiorum]MCP1634118.1 endonuclease YncB(thermonuclease family) [Kerstersia gyiorum]MCP1637724.1 endonuclease YncB(thermonuclease family) [Kerstersia gyiorum]MCP1670570.1 endonuclease YncB(thermonuclease family) [Kerstersia gyiorum]MCP1678777.1 endonuclease YncB(thermonuclease family) [Kerstersia gyiorum]MCP1683438.1 endonuclease YncB(thermonuclease family) [Kerstersia gyiorum]